MTRVLLLALAVAVAIGAAFLYGRATGATTERLAAIKRTEAAIHEVQNLADRARAMRRHCADLGLHYDFAAVRCVKG